MEIKGITIHNTNNRLSARENYNMLVENKQLNLCHYIIDKDEVIQTWPESMSASHTGKGYDMGNQNTLAIEIANSQEDRNIYFRAQNRAIIFIKDLMRKYDLKNEDIYFHKDFDSQSYCPHRILDLYGDKQNFIKETFNND